MARQTVTALAPSLNIASTALVAVAGSSSGLTIACDDFKRLNLFLHNFDVAGSVTVTIVGASSGTDWIATGSGNSTATILASSENRIWAGFDATKFKTTGDVLYVNMSATGTSYCENVRCYAWLMP